MKHIFLGNHPSIKKIRELVNIVSDTALSVLILGETGTGKDVVARLLYGASSRKDRPFVKVNCAALPLALLESELFGYEKGAFTGADKFKPGKFELASEGVIFLDEIGDMPLVLQAKLLQVLQGGEFTRLGGTEEVKVNTWIISSTNQDLSENMKKGLFREDLYYRLNIIKIELPPLRERIEDIPPLADYFIKKYKRELGIENQFSLTPEIIDLFQHYHWPGNVRELSSTILKLLTGDDPSKVQNEFAKNSGSNHISLFPESTPDAPPKLIQKAGEDKIVGDLPSLKDIKTKATEYIEKKSILYALKQTNWNKAEAAKLLKISYKALWYKILNLGIEKKRG